MNNVLLTVEKSTPSKNGGYVVTLIEWSPSDGEPRVIQTPIGEQVVPAKRRLLNKYCIAHIATPDEVGSSKLWDMDLVTITDSEFVGDDGEDKVCRWMSYN